MSTSRRPGGRKSRSDAQDTTPPAGISARATSAADPLPELMTAAEVADWLRTTVDSVYSKTERGTLPGATHVGRRLYFLRSELLALVEQGRVPYLGGPGAGT
jgi:helix-turn-helix protein